MEESDTTGGHHVGPVLLSRVPMKFDRAPQHRRAVLRVGDAAGMVNPLKGGDLSCPMEVSRLVADGKDVISTLQRLAPAA